MASAAYRNWVNDGKPKKYGRAIQAVAFNLRAHGYTVYMDGNQAHLQHDPPEDHTFFSATGWPSRSPYPYCLAADIMPPKPGQRSLLTGQLLPSLQQLSAQLYADKQAGHPGAAFVKYMNWEPERDGSGPCYHDTWTPDHARRNSSDRGHTHVSSRTDFATSAASDDYDLVARVMGDDDMPLADDQIALTADTAAEIGKKPGEKVSAATLLQLAVIYAARSDDKAGAGSAGFAALKAEVDDVQAKIAALAAAGGSVDLEALAERIAQKLADRLAQ